VGCTKAVRSWPSRPAHHGRRRGRYGTRTAPSARRAGARRADRAV